MKKIISRIAPVMILGMALSTHAFAEQSVNAAHAHIGHVMTHWNDTPSNHGLLPVAMKEAEIAAINESVAREKTINELLSPLSKDRARVMSDLLESVGTSKLKTSFDKYLPAVMNGNKSTMLNESKQSITSEVTGNRTAKVLETNDEGNIVEIKRLAGLY